MMGRETLIVHMADIRACINCSGGPRAFFKRHGLDWSAFLRNGIDAQQLVDTGDHLALQVVEAARERR